LRNAQDADHVRLVDVFVRPRVLDELVNVHWRRSRFVWYRMPFLEPV
jgi:hypothetical protein